MGWIKEVVLGDRNMTSIRVQIMQVFWASRGIIRLERGLESNV